MKILETALKQSQNIISQYWPLQSFIATNPLWDCTQEQFQKQLLKIVDTKSDVLYCERLAEYKFEDAISYVKNNTLMVLNNLVVAMCDLPIETQKTANVAQLIAKYLPQGELLKSFKTKYDYVTVIEHGLNILDIDSAHYISYFEKVFLTTYGYASLIKWMQNHPANPWLAFDLPCSAIIMIWLCFEVKLKTEGVAFSKNDVNSDNNLMQIYESQLVAEKDYQSTLLNNLNTTKIKTNPKLQAIFCIDTRSELLRRHLEQDTSIETFGFAGFFGFAFKLKKGNKISLQCPALLKPNEIVKITQNQKTVPRIKSSFIFGFKAIKKQILATFNFFEIFGPWFLFPYLSKTFFPKLSYKLSKAGANQKLDFAAIDIADISLEAAANSAYQMLKTIGLTDNFASKIVICGHQSISTNNPYAAALDCGACGGNSGMINAMVAVKCLNHPKIRRLVAKKGISIPKDTQFIAACHNTTYDEVVLHDDAVDLQNIFNQACKDVIAEKTTRFPMLKHLQRRQYDWAELVPEYALVNNAALIIGPRWLSQNVNLEGRVFLHSYDEEIDQDGAILESIMLAPLVVAHWINMQYYFSTVYPELFGAGNKALHNIIPGIGVMEGNFSDLKIGLPLQSIFYREQCLHTPQRLTVIIYADKQNVLKIVNKHEKLQQLVKNEWLFIYSLSEGRFEKLTAAQIQP